MILKVNFLGHSVDTFFSTNAIRYNRHGSASSWCLCLPLDDMEEEFKKQKIFLSLIGYLHPERRAALNLRLPKLQALPVRIWGSWGCSHHRARRCWICKIPWSLIENFNFQSHILPPKKDIPPATLDRYDDIIWGEVFQLWGSSEVFPQGHLSGVKSSLSIK